LHVLQVTGAGSGGGSHDLNPRGIPPDQVLSSTMEGEPLRGHQAAELAIGGHEITRDRHGAMWLRVL